MSKNDNGIASMYERIPAVAALNKAPGFDPVKLLRRTVSQKTKEPVMKLDLPYKKLWFRLLYPNGRIKLKALRVTEQMAIFEAQIFLDRTDLEPISSFTASCARENSPNGRYVEDAQEEATDEALSAAGFGLQFADISMTSQHRRFGSEIPIGDVSAQQVPARVTPAAGTVKPSQTEKPVQKAERPAMQKPAPTVAAKQPVTAQPDTVRKHAGTTTAPSVPTKAVPQARQATAAVQKQMASVQNPDQKNVVRSVPQVIESAATAVENVAPKHTAAVHQTVTATKAVPVAEQKDMHTQKALEILQGSSNAEPVNAAKEPPAIPAEPVVEPSAPASYDASTPVEQIMQVMTLEQARSVKIEAGIFAGKTLGEIADSNKAPNIRFYVYGGYKGKNNIFLAAAKIVHQALEQKAA